MRYQFIICKVLQKEAYFCAARSKNTIDIALMEQGLHNDPDKLRSAVQKALDVTADVAGREYDASLLGYGLCSNGIVGLKATIPIIIPRGHDCITLLLGSKERYLQYFEAHGGVYWYSTGWINDGMQPGKDRYEQTLRQYVEKYGQDNAQYLMEMEQNWMKEYERAVYIDWGFPCRDQEKDYTKQCAQFLGWSYDEIKGDPGLMQRLLDGQWDQEDFLVVEPGQAISEDLTNPGIIKAK
jgi:hypothetical protein